MPSSPPTSFDIDRCILAINGIRITGFGESDAISLEWGAPVASHRVGVDSRVSVAKGKDRTALLTVTCMGDSMGAKRLHGLARLQEASPLMGMDLVYQNLNNGDRISDPKAVFLEVGAPSAGANDGERVFKILLPNGRDNYALAENVTI